jgi:uncharacterized protein
MEHRMDVLPVARDRDGSEVTVTVHRLSEGEGPTLTMVGAQHGDEWLTVRYLRDVVEEAQGWAFRGTLVVVPVANPPGLRDVMRVGQPSSDEPDLNRIWTSTRTWLTSQLSATLAEHAIAGSSVVVDFHQGLWGSSFGGVGYATDYPDPAVSARSRELAFGFGYTCVERLSLMQVFPGPRSLAGYTGAVLGIPSLCVEIGGAGFDVAQERTWYEDMRRGTRNLMIQLGMLSGTPQLPERVLETGPTVVVTPRNGGLLIPAREPETLHRKVAAGEVLADVVCPQRLQVIEQLTAPVSGWLFCIARTYPVRPGDWAFAIAPETEAQWTSPTMSQPSSSTSTAGGPEQASSFSEG